MQTVKMLKKVKTYSLTTLVALGFLSACATSPKAVSPQDMNCAALLQEMKLAESEILTAEKELDQHMGVRTGGVISAQGGSSSGVGVGVGVSIGAPFNSYRKSQAMRDIEKLRLRFTNLQNEAVQKRCYI